MRRAAATVAVLVAGAAGALAWNVQSGFYSPFDSDLTRVCEDLILERLKAPSGYKRVKVVELTPDIGGKNGVGILYDAPNSYGAIIRGGGICEYEPAPDAMIDAEKVTLGGKTRAEWLFDLARGEPANRPAKPK
jgi:hypothetical protein